MINRGKQQYPPLILKQLFQGGSECELAHECVLSTHCLFFWRRFTVSFLLFKISLFFTESVDLKPCLVFPVLINGINIFIMTNHLQKYLLQATSSDSETMPCLVSPPHPVPLAEENSSFGWNIRKYVKCRGSLGSGGRKDGVPAPLFTELEEVNSSLWASFT